MKKLDLLKPGGGRTKQLTELSRDINDSQDAIDLLEQQTKSKGNEWLCEIALQGQRLLKIKEIVGHGKWLEWLEANCPLVSERKAQRYIRVATNATRVSEMGGANSLREALRLCADPPEEQSEPNSASAPKSWPAFVELIGRFAKFVSGVERHPLEKWPLEGKEKLREKMLPLATALWPERFA